MRFKKGDLLRLRNYSKKPEVYLLVSSEKSVYDGFYKAIKPSGEIVLLNIAMCWLAVPRL